MVTSDFSALLAPVREHGQAMLASCEDPHAELMALVWGPRFDRLHAQSLLTRQNQQNKVEPAALQSVVHAAELFDQLPGQAQARVRKLILRHRASGTMPHAPHFAD